MLYNDINTVLIQCKYRELLNSEGFNVPDPSKIGDFEGLGDETTVNQRPRPVRIKQHY
jgi:hypothetical protein